MPVYTIAFGTPHGTVTLTPQPGAPPVRQPVHVDEAALRELAHETGDRAYDAASLEELGEVYTDIRSSLGYRRAEREITTRFVGWALRHRAESTRPRPSNQTTTSRQRIFHTL